MHEILLGIDTIYFLLPVFYSLILSPSSALGQLISGVEEEILRLGDWKNSNQLEVMTSGLPYLQDQRDWLAGLPTNSIWLFARLPTCTCLVTWDFCFHFVSYLPEAPYSIFPTPPPWPLLSRSESPGTELLTDCPGFIFASFCLMLVSPGHFLYEEGLLKISEPGLSRGCRDRLAGG